MNLLPFQAGTVPVSRTHDVKGQARHDDAAMSRIGDGPTSERASGSRPSRFGSIPRSHADNRQGFEEGSNLGTMKTDGELEAAEAGEVEVI